MTGMQRQAEERDSYVVEKTRELPLSFSEDFAWGSYVQAEMLGPLLIKKVMGKNELIWGTIRARLQNSG